MLVRMWEKEASYTVGGNVNYYNHCGNQKLGIYLKECKSIYKRCLL
jgi:hypothetical protein